MRAFIGIPFENEVTEYLKDLQDMVFNKALKSNPTLKDNFHLTLLFLGEIDEIQQRRIELALDNLENGKQFEIVLDHLGEFQKGNEAILWVGVNQGLIELQSLQKKVVDSVNAQGFYFRNDVFKAHVTLARQVIFKQGFNINQIKINPYKLKVDRIHLYESHRVNGILTYTPRKTVLLK